MFPQIFDCEGFFVARLRKTAAIDALPAPKFKVGNFPFAPLKGRETAQITEAAQKSAFTGMKTFACGSATKRSGSSRSRSNR